ncbi:unnamed protein product [Anisakis simplex]|uniref:DNA-directed RNA polymerase n=1 Tax=Anisakis simplex TaxID=6269 RepID=A0A0M3KKJ7_ANISI|nr:unnamed protein product [Anisakis simplex]
MQFYDAQREPLNNSLGAMTNVSLNANPSSIRSNGSSVDEYGNGNKHRHYEAAAAAGTGRVGVSDKMQVKVTLANLMFVMTHKDALGYESMSVGALNEREQVMGVIRRVESVANRFFERAAGIQFSSRSRLAGMRERCDGLYEDDHLR